MRQAVAAALKSIVMLCECFKIIITTKLLLWKVLINERARPLIVILAIINYYKVINKLLLLRTEGISSLLCPKSLPIKHVPLVTH